MQRGEGSRESLESWIDGHTTTSSRPGLLIAGPVLRHTCQPDCGLSHGLPGGGHCKGGAHSPSGSRRDEGKRTALLALPRASRPQTSHQTWRLRVVGTKKRVGIKYEAQTRVRDFARRTRLEMQWGRVRESARPWSVGQLPLTCQLGVIVYIILPVVPASVEVHLGRSKGVREDLL